MEEEQLGEVVGGIFGALFGSPFFIAGLFPFFEGGVLLISEGRFEGLFLISFGLVFMGVGGTMVFAGLYTLGRGIGLIKPKDPSLIPRNGSIGPESIQIEHPESYYSGVYERQSNIINGKDWYRKIGGTQRLYFYDKNEGGSSGWSLDDRIDNGGKDWFNGGWIPPMSHNNIPFGTHEWNDIEGAITIQVSENNDNEARENLLDSFKQQLSDSIN